MTLEQRNRHLSNLYERKRDPERRVELLHKIIKLARRVQIDAQKADNNRALRDAKDMERYALWELNGSAEE